MGEGAWTGRPRPGEAGRAGGGAELCQALGAARRRHGRDAAVGAERDAALPRHHVVRVDAREACGSTVLGGFQAAFPSLLAWLTGCA